MLELLTTRLTRLDPAERAERRRIRRNARFARRRRVAELEREFLRSRQEWHRYL